MQNMNKKKMAECLQKEELRLFLRYEECIKKGI